jgi:hypothetical protein
MFFSAYTPMVLYHCTVKSRLPQIRRRGLKPYVLGRVWGACDPVVTRNKPVVWLTADPTTWKHDRHPKKAWRDPEKVLLPVLVNWGDPDLLHYMSWIDPRKKDFLEPSKQACGLVRLFRQDFAQTDYVAMTKVRLKNRG